MFAKDMSLLDAHMKITFCICVCVTEVGGRRSGDEDKSSRQRRGGVLQ